MKASIIVPVLSMALAVSAMPTTPTTGGTCNTGSNVGSTTGVKTGSNGVSNGGTHKQVCCNSLGDLLGGLLNLGCIVQVLGDECNGTKKSCSTDAATVSIPPTLDTTT